MSNSHLKGNVCPWTGKILFPSSTFCLKGIHQHACVSIPLTFHICLVGNNGKYISKMEIKVGEVKPVKDLIVITIVVAGFDFRVGG